MWAMLALATCAMLSGARSLYAIGQWGRDQGIPVAQALGFSRDQTPCVATLHRVFRRLDRGAFERVLTGWLQEQGLRPAEPLATDGKQLRGIHGGQLPGVHLVASWWTSRRWERVYRKPGESGAGCDPGRRPPPDSHRSITSGHDSPSEHDHQPPYGWQINQILLKPCVGMLLTHQKP